jgi:hypothetical protein
MAKSKKYYKKSKGRKTRKHRHRYLGKKCALCSKKKMKGGSCSSCQMNLNKMIGGNFYKPAAPMPGPFVGQSWNPPTEDWPGVNGVGGDRNYLAYNSYPTDPQTAMVLGGSRRRRKGKGKSKRSKRGGILGSQDLVNVTRDIGFNMGSAYNSLMGYPAPVNPAPYKDQLTGTSHTSYRAMMA